MVECAFLGPSSYLADKGLILHICESICLAFNAIDYVPWVMECLESFFIINADEETMLWFLFNF